MPTLMHVPKLPGESGNVASTNPIDGIEDEVYNGDESTIFEENHSDNGKKDGETILYNNELKDISRIYSPGPRARNNKSVTFDESFILRSASKRGRYSRRDTLTSDVSILSSDTVDKKDKSILMTQTKIDHSHNLQEQELHSLENREKSARAWPRRDEYIENYQLYVKNAISKFGLKFPGILRNYKHMSLEEKNLEQQKVLALLTRLGVSKNDLRTSKPRSPLAHGCKNFDSPVKSNRFIDESISPLFSPNCDVANDENSIEPNQSGFYGEKSELLLSMDDEDNTDTNTYKHRKKESNLIDDNKAASATRNEDFEIPINDDEDEMSSKSSMEIVRRAAVDDSHNSDKRLSCMTPERKMFSSRKREASSSGKRGADLRRSRHNDQEDEHGPISQQKVDDIDLTARLGRLSISPSLSTPPKDLFITSQSPISPRLTYPSPDGNESDSFEDRNFMKRISLGRYSNECKESNRQDYRRDSNITDDSMVTNTPSRRYQSKKDKRRAFREVPVNVVLRKGATFHLEKIAMKRSERIPSKKQNPSDRHIKARKRHQLVNFSDPLAHYGSRNRRALKEIYSWIRRAECEFEEGRCMIPAVGTFFSLSEQQIIDISLKLLLSEHVEKSQYEDAQSIDESVPTLKGKTLVVVRSKDDTATWESALRDGSGCSVLNHSTLPLSERIRASTSERVCLYDVVLTTYDAMKSPDITIPMTNDGRAILTKSKNDRGWHSSRSSSQQDQTTRQQTKKLSILHRVEFKRIIFVDTLGRKCYLAKSGTARATASVALSSSSCRLVFFRETQADGSDALLALRKSDKRAFQSVSSVLHLTDLEDKSDTDDSSEEEDYEDPLENIAMDLKDLVC